MNDKYEDWYIEKLRKEKEMRMDWFKANKRYVAIVVSVFFIIIMARIAFKRVLIEPGCVGVIISQPYFIGSGGLITNYTMNPGAHWTWRSNGVFTVSIQPNQFKEAFADIISADNIPVEFDGFFNYFITDSLQRIKLGDRWYENNIQQTFKTLVRDECKKYKMTSLISDRQTVADIELNVFIALEKHIKDTNLPIKLTKVNIGKINPTEAVMTEIGNTAVQQQRQRTQQETKLAEDARRATEISKAAADNAYREAMHLDPAQFIQLQALTKYAEAAHACAASKDCMMVLSQPGTGLTLPTIRGK
jgi:regulator of protease activity HflC (stomatin/prohibitin superfamily)